MIPSLQPVPESRWKTVTLVWLVTLLLGCFWTWCFAILGHYFHRGSPELLFGISLLLRPGFSLLYYAGGLAVTTAVAWWRTGWVYPLLAIQHVAYPCAGMFFVCEQMGRMDFAMGN